MPAHAKPSPSTVFSPKRISPYQRIQRAGLALLLLLVFSAAAQAQLGSINYTTVPDGNGGLVITAFSATGTGSLTIPATISGLPVTGIANSAFFGNTNLTGVTIPASVTNIGQEAFGGCFNLTSVSIPASVTSIGNAPFYQCASLTTLTVDSNNPAYSSTSDGALFDKQQATLLEYAGVAGSYTVPATVTSIASYAFDGCTGLTGVTIPNTVTSIGNYAFDGCSSLTGVTLPTGLTSIAKNTFYQCSSLSSVTLPPSLTSLGQAAFDGCSGLTQVTIPSGVTSLGNSAFAYCTGLTRVSLPDTLTSIGSSDFYSCTSLATVTIPSSVTGIGAQAFEACNTLTSALFQGNAPTAGSGAFTSDGTGFTVSYYPGATGFTSPTWTDSSNDTYPAVSAGPFGALPLGGGWFYSNWFGPYNTTFYPWIYRTDLGFIYVFSSNNTDLYLYVVNGNSGSLGWLYTSESFFPNVYSFQKGTWLYFNGGTSFYNYNAQVFEMY